MRFCARKPMGKWVNSNSVLLAPTSSFGQTKSARSILMILCRRCRSKATNLTKFPHRSPAIVMSCKKNRVVFQRCVYFFYFFKIEYVVSSLASFSIQGWFWRKNKKVYSLRLNQLHSSGQTGYIYDNVVKARLDLASALSLWAH